MKNPDCIQKLEQIRELFVSRVRGMFGETPEFNDWLDSFDFADKYPHSDEAWAVAEESLKLLRLCRI
jgi:hypothetical protein